MIKSKKRKKIFFIGVLILLFCINFINYSLRDDDYFNIVKINIQKNEAIFVK